MIDARQRLWLFWPVILAHSWESCLTNYRVSQDYQGPEPPRWSANGVIWLKPANFREATLRVLDEMLAARGTPLPPREQAELDEARQRLDQELYQRLGLAAPLQAHGAAHRTHPAAAVLRYVLHLADGHQ